MKEGSQVLAKQKDKLWHRAKVKTILDNNKCLVQFESKGCESLELDLQDLLPLEGKNCCQYKLINYSFVSINAGCGRMNVHQERNFSIVMIIGLSLLTLRHDPFWGYGIPPAVLGFSQSPLPEII